MRIILLLAAIASTTSAIKLSDAKKDPSTGTPIPICNGANDRFGGKCETAETVVKHDKAAHGWNIDHEWSNSASIYGNTETPH